MYHEYQTSDGRIVRRHYNGQRMGVETPIRRWIDPWESMAMAVMNDLADYLGSEMYGVWAEMTWPGAAIDECSWQQIHDTAAAAFAIREHLHESLQCTCLPEHDACEFCAAVARRNARLQDNPL